MLVLVLVLVVLQFEGTRGEELHLYHRRGENVVLPCNSPSSFSSCSDVKWFYNRNKNTQQEVWNGTDIYQDSRLNMDSSCSLTINDVYPQHSGLYICRPGSDASSDGDVYLNVLTNFPPYSKSKDTFHCSLWRFSGLDLCPEKSFRWLDETGAELTEGVWFELRGPKICVSSLPVKHQSDRNRNFTCQFVEENRVKVETHNTPSWLEVDRGELVHLYHRAGDEAVLPCNRPSSSDSCSSVDWNYKKNEDMNYEQEVHKGIVQSSPRSARLSLDRKCSLIINNITKEDAGCYKCQLWDKGSYETHVHLNVMIISSSAPDPDPTENGDVTLLCFLSSRRFTCQFVEGNEVKVEAHYGSDSKGPPASSPLSFIMLTLKITGLILMVGLTVGIIRTRGRKKPQKDIKVRFAADDDTVDYENDAERSAAAALH